MESQYNLPYRPSDIRTFPEWAPHPQQPYAIVSSEQQQLQYQHPQQHQQLRHHNRLPTPAPAPVLSTILPSPLVSLQNQSPLQYGQNNEAHTPAPMLYHTQQLSSFGQPYPVVQSHRDINASTLKNAQSLPLPSQILPSQNASRGPCIACGKSDCNLSSHRHFSKHVQMNARNKRLSSSTASTPKSTHTMLAVSTHMADIQPSSSGMLLDPQREQLLALWSKDWAPIRIGPERHLFPINFIDKVLPAAKRHPPLLQALLAYSGTVWAIANNVLSDVASAQQAFAVELLSQACPTEREASTDEGMLAATLLLLIYMAQGNGYEVGKHVSGLVHLTKLRGGPHYLGLGGLVADTLMYADHMQAIFFNQEPVWHLALPPLDIGLPPRAGQGFQKESAARELDPPLIWAAKSLCKVADIFDEGSGGRPLSSMAKNAFGYLTSITEYQLARCNAAYSHGADPNECICLALILFHYVILNSDGAITPTILQVEHRFWHSLEAAEAKGLKSKLSPCLYMWMITAALSVGVRVECQYRALGIDKLRNIRQAARVHNWEHFRRDVLDEFVWLVEAQGDSLRGIWADVEGRNNNSTPIVPGHKLNLLPPAG